MKAGSSEGVYAYVFSIKVTKVDDNEFYFEAINADGETIVPSFRHGSIVGGLHIVNVSVSRTAANALALRAPGKKKAKVNSVGA